MPGDDRCADGRIPRMAGRDMDAAGRWAVCLVDVPGIGPDRAGQPAHGIMSARGCLVHPRRILPRLAGRPRSRPRNPTLLWDRLTRTDSRGRAAAGQGGATTARDEAGTTKRHGRLRNVTRLVFWPLRPARGNSLPSHGYSVLAPELSRARQTSARPWAAWPR